MPLKVLGKIIDVNSAEARDLVYEELLALVKRHEAGLATFMDIYWRVVSEPLLTDEEKRELLRSPTPATVLRLWRGRQARYELDGIAIPEPDDRAVLVVAMNNATIAKQYNPQRYPWLTPLTRRPNAINITNVFKAVTAMVKYKDAIKAVVIVGLPWRYNTDGLAAIVAMARLAGIPVIANVPIVVVEEKRLVEAVETRAVALLEWAVNNIVKVSVNPNDVNRFQAALREFVTRYHLEEQLEALFGYRVDNYVYWSPWWDYRLGGDAAEDVELRRLLEEAGLPSWLAAKLSRRRYESINDVVKALQEASIYVDATILRRVAEAYAKRFNTQPEVLLQLLEILA